MWIMWIKGPERNLFFLPKRLICYNFTYAGSLPNGFSITEEHRKGILSTRDIKKMLAPESLGRWDDVVE